MISILRVDDNLKLILTDESLNEYVEQEQHKIIELLTRNLENDSVVYCNDFSQLSKLIISVLIRSGGRETEKIKRNGNFNYLCSEDGDMFRVCFMKENKKIELYDMNRCISKAETDAENIELLKMFCSMTKKRHLTIGSACMDVFRHTITQKFRDVFPELDNVTYEEIKDAYKGGIVECFKPGMHKNGVTIDVHSMYSKQMRDELMPAYYPIKCEEKPTGLYIVNFDACLELKPGGFPYIVSDGGFGKNTLLISTFGEIKNFTLTSIEYDMLEQNYYILFEYTNYYYAFRSKKGIFNEYIDMFYNMKQNNTGAKRKTAKLFLNNLCGKFAKKPRSSNRSFYVNDGMLESKVEDGKIGKTVYLPVAAFVNSYAKRFLVETAEKIGLEYIIYCDTDSLHITCPDAIKNKGIILSDKLGSWDIEKKWSEGLFLGKKRYITDDKLCLAGYVIGENVEVAAKEIITGNRNFVQCKYKIYNEKTDKIEIKTTDTEIDTKIKKTSKSKLAGWIYDNRN